MNAPAPPSGRPVGDPVARTGWLAPLRALQIVLMLAAIGYAAAAYTPGGSPSRETDLRAGVLGGAVLLMLPRAALVPRGRLAWLAGTLGVAAWSVGDLARRLPDIDLPDYPAPTDLAPLALAPLLALGTLALLRGTESGRPGLGWLDGLVAGLGAAALAGTLALPAALDAAAPGGAARAADLARPIAAVALLGLLAGALAAAWRRAGAGWLALVTGGLLLAAADLAQLALAGLHRGGAGLVPVQPLGVAVIASAAWLPGRSRSVPRGPGLAPLLAPLLAAAVALGLLLYGDWRDLNRPAVLLAGGCLLLYGLRSALAYRETRALAASRHQAATDYLTGLGNRRLFDLRLALAAATRRPDQRLALVLLGLDRFKEINDSLGRDTGDALLRQIGPRLREVVGGEDVIARLAGDTFAVLAWAGADEVVDLGRRLLGTVDRPFLVGEVALVVEATVGIAAMPEHATDALGLVRGAEAALAHAKTAHTGLEVYDPTEDSQRGLALGLVEDLRAAIEDGQLTVHYQPIVELRAGAVVAVEALVRWRHPTRGLLAPDAFLPLAERSGLMRRLTVSVLDRALGQSRAWRDRGLGMRIAVNLSVSTLLDARLPYDVARLLNEHGVHPTVLTFEITEDVLLADPNRGRRAVDRLRTLGVGAAIDDYGRGNSSLALLRTLRVDELKLDRGLVAEITNSRRDAAIVRSAIDLAHSLGLRVTAAGVQAAGAAELLYEAGCDLAQGTLVCPPLPPGTLTDWLIRQGVASAEVPPPRPFPAPVETRRTDSDPALRT
ncbi:MAG: hypothetical protein V7637_60 [Mycobacteriales bacterium]